MLCTVSRPSRERLPVPMASTSRRERRRRERTTTDRSQYDTGGEKIGSFFLSVMKAVYVVPLFGAIGRQASTLQVGRAAVLPGAPPSSPRFFAASLRA